MILKLICKVWYENDNGIVFGQGAYCLLRGIEKTGSLRQAAFAVGMAYSKAWHIIKICECNLGSSLTHARRGGISRGGSEVTDKAMELMRMHELFCREIENTIGKIYEKHFGQSVPVLFHAGKRYRRQLKIETVNEAEFPEFRGQDT
jgi:molybdate transport repressor ModE-like protein